MAQEEKQLLLKDLCARLPYNIICSTTFGDCSVLYVDIQEGTIYIPCNEWVYYFKPYLRPMSSMTEEEKEELRLTYDLIYSDSDSDYPCDEEYDEEDSIEPHYEPTIETFDWYNKKMFDYRGLIPRGLALIAPEGMYK